MEEYSTKLVSGFTDIQQTVSGLFLILKVLVYCSKLDVVFGAYFVPIVTVNNGRVP